MGTTRHRALALVLIAAAALAGPGVAYGFAPAAPHLSSTYFGARYYQANLGRFTTVDPLMDKDAALRNPQLWNRYAYSNNDPLRFIDPDGKAAVAIPKGRLESNAKIRATVHQVISTAPGIGYDPQIAAFGVDLVLGMFMPATPGEYAAQIEGAAFGMVAPLAAPGRAAATVAMEEAVARGARHVAGEGVMETTGNGLNYQFRRTIRNAAGEV